MTVETMDKIVIWVMKICAVLYLLAILAALASCSPYTQPAPTPTNTPHMFQVESVVDGEGQMPSPTPRPTCTVTGETVYIRSGAGMGYAVIEIVTKGEALTMLQPGEWNHVKTRTTAGYIYGKFCQKEIKP